MLGTTLFPLLLAYAPKGSKVWSLCSTAAFGAISVGGWNALTAISPELYDTGIRATMYALLGIIGRMGAFIGTSAVGHLIKAGGVWLACICASATLFCGCLSTLGLPETKGRVLVK